MSYEVSLDALGTSYSIPEAGQTNYANDLSLYLRDLATVVNDASGGSLVTPVFNVKTYGATGNGSTDDTAAINLAKAALLAASSTGGTLYFPAGTYKTSSTLQFGVSAAQSGVRVEGDGPNSIIKPTGSFSTTPVIEFRNSNYWVVTNIKIDASARTGSGDNILVDGCSFGYCTNATIANATRYGVNVTQVSGASPSTYNVVNLNVFSGNATANTHLTFTPPNVGSVVNDASGDVLVYADTSAYYDIRTYGAVPGAAGKTATTAAFNAIFAAINWGYFPDVGGARAAVIYVPAIQDSWYTGDLDAYVGSPGAAIYMRGDMPSGRSSIEGSTLIFDGTDSTTWFKFLGINASTIENITFNGGGKALVNVQVSQKWYGAPNNTQIGSSGVRFNNCQFVEPKGNLNSILVQAGEDSDPPNTLQSSEYRFYNCQFQGHNSIQGWGFKAVVGGNTKNFTFDNCTFSYVYRGIETSSGYLICREVQGANIGYDRDNTAAMIYTGAISVDVTGGGMENGTTGYFARWLITGQGTPVHLDGCYIAATAPGDDYLIDTEGFLHIEGGNYVNSRTMSTAIAWTPTTNIALGQQRKNDTSPVKLYKCITPGITAGSGGPTGTGSDITDGSVHWQYLTGSDGNAAKVKCATEDSGSHGSVIIENNAFPYISTPIVAVPVYDGSNNPIGASVGRAGTDYAKSVSHLLYCRGNRTGVFGSDIDQVLPDFNGRNIINTRDQLWNDNLATTCTTLRNDTGVAIITVPFAAAVAAGVGSVRLSDPPAGYRFTEAIIDVTTLFAGPGVSGIEASLGTSTTTATSILLSANIETTGQIGMDIADRGAGWNGDRYIIPFGTSPSLEMKFTVSGGLLANINAGSLNVYLQFQRLKL